MDAVEYLKEVKRMCSKQRSCVGCLLENYSCNYRNIENPEKSVDIVEKWSEKHPVKTRQSEFLRMFPNADIDKDGVLIAIPCHIDKNMKKVYCQALNGCVECRKDYWLAEVE